MNANPSKNTLVFLLTKAFNNLLYPRQIVIEHSYGNGYFCHSAKWEVLSDDEIQKVETQLFEWLDSETPILLESRSRERVWQDLVNMNSLSKLELLKQWNVDSVPIIQYGKDWDLQLGVMETDKSRLKIFELLKYNDGFIIRFQNQHGEIPPFKDQPKLFSIFEEHERWGSILGVSTIRELNELIRSGGIREMIWVAEGLHEKKISDIADKMGAEFPEKRIISIAGPSSSGKTTFAKRLGIQLRVNGYKTVQISMDDYFIDRNKIRPDKDGQLDFEAIYSLNVDLLCHRLQQLLEGTSIQRRKYDFQTGRGHDTGEEIVLDECDFIILEGIHGLNPIFKDKLGEDRLQRIYVSAITQMNIDANHRVSTSDNRLLRRMVRDNNFRGYSTVDTLDRWSMVRRGEEHNIFPFQEEANCMFNSSLIYELPVLAKYAVPLLKKVDKDSKFFVEAERLMLLLSFFEILDEKYVPGISILKEFIGNSDFNY